MQSMNQHLLTIAAEEVDEVQPGGDNTRSNEQRIVDEFTDLVTLLDMLGIVTLQQKEDYEGDETAAWTMTIQLDGALVLAKREKVATFTAYSQTLGRVDPSQTLEP